MSFNEALYGHMVDGQEVEDAVASILALWLPDSLAAQADRRGYTDPLPVPGAAQVWPDETPEERWPEHQLPALGIGSPGTVGEPVKDGDGSYRATWSIGIGITVSANSPQATRKLSRVYGAAIRQALLQRRSLGGFAYGMGWGGESYTALGTASSRTQAIAINSFTVEVADVVSVHHGPATTDPPADGSTDPADGFPYTAERVGVDVERIPLT